MTGRSHFISIAVFLAAILFSFETDLSAYEKSRPGLVAFRQACDSVESYMSARCWCQYPIFVKTAYIANKGRKNARLEIVACRDMAFFPFRDGDIEHIYSIFKKMMPAKYAQYRNRFTIRANNHILQAYSPAYFSEKGADYYVREHKVAKIGKNNKPLFTDISRPFSIPYGLAGKHIALWQSHGYYFNLAKEKWEWQRGRIFGTSEDLYTQSYVIPFLVPMLENAGAVVMMPRERDINSNEIIVDNDIKSSGYTESGRWSTAPKKGFMCTEKPILFAENPFKSGTARQIHDSNGSFFAKWQPEIIEDGDYSVYISYQSLPSSSDNVRYTVHYDGGSRSFRVNQKMGGSTWVHLGRFRFIKGRRDNQYVILECRGKNPDDVITADAVKFGGGKGNVSRNKSTAVENTSGKPRYMEAARYWLQWAGFNDTVYSASSFTNDYKDDVKCRALWVNSLIDDYSIPLDLSFAFHTDAGLMQKDSIVGTLAIHSWKYENSIRYKNGERRFLGRDFADIVQTQVVDDIRAIYNPTWTRRGLWDRNYAECSPQQVPSMILEFLSHQNFNDMRYGLDPEFRFNVSRSVYKGIVKFISWLNESKCVIQPLPVNSFNIGVRNVSGRNYAVLSWKATKDILEPTAVPDKYIIYKRIDNGDFDNGTVVTASTANIEIQEGHLYSFKVSAANDGGASFPSEILCAAVSGKTGKYALVVNNFTRISAPASFITSDSLKAGFRYDEDAGVPYLYDIAYCGEQYEFNVNAEWESNDNPGFGASKDDYESTYMAGNTFDFVARHSRALIMAGYGVVSTSRESLLNDGPVIENYPLLDIICGKQKSSFGTNGSGRDYSVFPDKMCEMLTKYASSGRTLIVSGAYIASDAYSKPGSPASDFASNILHIESTGKTRSNSGAIKSASGAIYNYYTAPNPKLYHIEKPEGLAPSGSKVQSILHFNEGKVCAGVIHKSKEFKSATLSLPIEAMKTQEETDSLMKYLLEKLK